MATVTVDQAKLVLNSFAAIFQNNLVSSDLVTWRKFTNEMNDRNALTVVEQVVPRYVAVQSTSAVTDLSGGVQDTVFGSEQYKVDQVFNTSMGWADFVKIRDIGDARESEAIKSAALNLAEKIDGYIMAKIATASNNWTGTAGNNVATYTDMVQGYTRLKEEGVDDADLRAVLTYADKQALGDWVVNNNDSALNSADGIYRQGFTGSVGGIPTLFTQQLQNITNGNDVTGVAVNGASQSSNYASVAISGAPGQYKTQLLNIKGVTATTGTVTAGSVFTIANVNAWDNRTNQTLGRLQQFVVVTGGTADGSGNVSIRIWPAIIVQGSSNVNTAHATVDSVPADSAAMTFVGVASTAYKPRFILQKSAVTVNTADLIMPATGIASRKSLTKLPLSVRMWQDSVFATGEHRVRFDVALSADISAGGRNRIVRINGA
jgi:hypothetical protein